MICLHRGTIQGARTRPVDGPIANGRGLVGPVFGRVCNTDRYSYAHSVSRCALYVDVRLIKVSS